MRKALLAVVLIGASFAGGAFVNGPGLHWAKSTLMAKLGIETDEDDETTPDTVAKADDTPNDTIPPLAKEPSAVPHDSQAQPKAPEPSQSNKTVAKASAKPAVPLAATDAPPEMEPIAPLPSPLDQDTPDASVAQTAAEKPPQPFPLNDSEIAKPQGDAPSDEIEIPASPADWTEVRRVLKALGVTRYGTEGETSGRVRFFCLIPAAGRKAVSRHFEAEGDDELQAAQAVIRRIGLWQAASNSEPASSP